MLAKWHAMRDPSPQTQNGYFLDGGSFFSGWCLVLLELGLGLSWPGGPGVELAERPKHHDGMER
jgi:hypothetical protein